MLIYLCFSSPGDPLFYRKDMLPGKGPPPWLASSLSLWKAVILTNAALFYIFLDTSFVSTSLFL